MKKETATKKTHLAGRQIINIIMLAFASVTIYELSYMHFYYYDTMREALNLTNTQFGTLFSAFGVVAAVSYIFGGILADKFSAKRLLYIALFVNGITGIYFSTFPSYGILLGIYIVWGITTSMMFWSASIKVCSSLGGSEIQGRLFGTFEGVKGLLPLLYSMPILWLFNSIGGGLGGIRMVILMFSGLSFAGGIVAMFIKVPKQDDVIEGKEKQKKLFDELKYVVTIPEVWLLAFVIFFNYAIIITQRYVAPFFTEVFMSSVAIAAIVGYIRNYVIGIFGAPVGGFFADKMQSCAKTLKYSYVGLIMGSILFLALPFDPKYIWLGVGAMAFINIFIFINRGVYFGVVDEISVPSKFTGTAIGLISLIAFSPEAFLPIIIGQLLDNFPGGIGYKGMYGMSLGFAVAGFVVCIILCNRIKSKKIARQKAVDVKPVVA